MHSIIRVNYPDHCVIVYTSTLVTFRLLGDTHINLWLKIAFKFHTFTRGHWFPIMNNIHGHTTNTFVSSLDSDRDRNVDKRRTNYIEWDEYFMATAFLAAKRSKDPSSQVGACIVNAEKKIVGVGYNGMPIGCQDDKFPWSKTNSDRLETKYLYVCHAEMNAILNKNSADVKDCTIYVGLFPCNECAKMIIQSGIKTVIYMSDKHWHKVETVAAKKMFDAVGVEYRQYIPKNEKIVIDFSEINWNEMTQLPPTPGKSCK